MKNLIALNPSELILELILESLRVRNDRLNEIASELICRYGAKMVPLLMNEVINRQNPIAFRLRVLGVIECIGRLGPHAWIDLNILCADKNSRIREAAMRLMFSRRLVVEAEPTTS